MFYLGRRVVFILIVCFLAIQSGQAIKSSYADVPPSDIGHTAIEGVPDTNAFNTEEALEAHEEMKAADKACEIKESEQEKVLIEAGEAIADAEKLINEYDEMKFQDTESVSRQTLKENIIIADRGGYKGYKLYDMAPRYHLSDEEFNLMAQVVMAEAGGEPYEGQVAVANVIFNRVKNGWGGTITEVITQEGQFTQNRKEPSVSVKDAVKEALYDRNAVPEGTLFFQNLDTSTDFTIPNSKEYVTKIGLHSFYR